LHELISVSLNKKPGQKEHSSEPLTTIASSGGPFVHFEPYGLFRGFPFRTPSGFSPALLRPFKLEAFRTTRARLSPFVSSAF